MKNAKSLILLTCVCHRVVGEHTFAAEDVPAVGFDCQDNFAQTNRTVMLAGSNAS
jgi:hypothetical protein